MRPEVKRAKAIGDALNYMAAVRRESLELLNDIPDVPSAAQRELLGILLRHSRGITVKEIARITKITSSAATQRVEQLEKRGLIERRISTRDNRYVTIQLSLLGRRRVARHLILFSQRLDNSCMHVLSDHELLQLHALLTKVAHNLEPS